MNKESTEEIIIPRIRDQRGQVFYKTCLSPHMDKRDKVILASISAPIPVVFLPGIMGTNLRNKESKKPVWRPPNTSLSPGDWLTLITAIFIWFSRGPKKRQHLLKANLVEVDDRGPIDTSGCELSKEAARFRGWGSVMRSSYNPPMALFEQRLGRMVYQRELEPWWREHGMAEPFEYGEELGRAEPLDEQQLINAGRYQFDVWCAGYNWLQSNRQSAADVRDYIENTVLAHYRNCNRLSTEQAQKMKVILVTHSMGGLVARTLTQLLGYERVLGVVHGVQPASGAPAIYHHMRCGYEGAPQIVLGSNAGEVTAVVANAPGALELTPSAEHRGGRPWLFIRDDGGWKLRDEQGQVRAYPSQGNPYEEIYKSSAWYGLVPEQNTKYLDMSNTLSDDPEFSSRSVFTRIIDVVKAFHFDLDKAKYHPETYAHYGADDRGHSWRDVNWVGNPSTLETSDAKPKDNGNGTYNIWFKKGLPEVQPTRDGWHDPSEIVGAGGDGTVPTDAGQAPGQAGIRASFRHGNQGHGAYNTNAGYDHQDSYLDPRAQWATLYAIVKISQLANWHPSDKEPS